MAKLTNSWSRNGTRTSQVLQNRSIKVDLRKWMQVNHPELDRRGISQATCRYLGCGFLPDRPSGARRSPLNGRVVFQVRGVAENASGLKPVIFTQ